MAWLPQVEQFLPIQSRMGQELNAVYNRQKTVVQALNDLEIYVNDILTRPIGEVGR